MLETETIQKIEEFVYLKPRSVDEIAKYIDKNWRTADRYIREIEENYGTITTTVFREGSRGALKVVYWASVEKASQSKFQQRLEEEILREKGKHAFSSFEIYQHVADKNKHAYVEEAASEDQTKENIPSLKSFVENTKKQLIMFSGNLSFANLKTKEIDLYKIFDDLVKKGVSIKIVCRVDLAGRENVEKMLSLNYKYGKELVEIRHRDQPLRALISDNKAIRLKEIKEPTGRTNELNKRLFIFYAINDKSWAEWLSKIFWNMFSSSIDASKRLEELKKLM